MVRTHSTLETVIIIAVVLFLIYSLDNPLWCQLSGIGHQLIQIATLGLTKLTAYLSTLQ